MFTSDGTITTNLPEIMKEIEMFYSDLYAANEESLHEYHPLLDRPEIPKLSPRFELSLRRKVISEGML